MLLESVFKNSNKNNNILVVIDSNGELNTQTKFAIQATLSHRNNNCVFGIVCIGLGVSLTSKKKEKVLL